VRIFSVSAAVIGLMLIGGPAAFAQAPKAKPAARTKAPARPSGDAVAGATAFVARCKVCHGAEGVGTVIGPDLRGVYGRAAATGTYAKYSTAMKASGLTWNEATLET